MSVGGGIFAAKQNPGLQDNVTYKVFTREERHTIDHFSAPDRRISFVPSRLTLETMGGEVVRVRGADERIPLGYPPRRLFYQLCSMDLPKSPLPLHLSRFRCRRDR